MTLSDTEQLRQWRRMFHQLPEPGWSEFITTARLIEMLRAMGYRVLPGAAFLSREHIQGRNEEEVAQGLARAGLPGRGGTAGRDGSINRLRRPTGNGPSGANHCPALRHRLRRRP